MTETLGERIRRHRVRLRMTQGELGDLVGLSTNWISAIEAGHADPKASRLKALAQELGVSTDYLLGLDDRENSRTPPKRPRPRTTAPVS